MRERHEHVSLFSDSACERLVKKKSVKRTMAHLFRQMYVDEIDFEALTIEKLTVLVFTEMVHRKIQQLEKETLAKQDQTDGNQWSTFRKCPEVPDDEERWIAYAERALSLLNHELIWQAMFEFGLKQCLICHVSFGFRCTLNSREQCLLTILLTILFVCVN